MSEPAIALTAEGRFDHYCFAGYDVPCPVCHQTLAARPPSAPPPGARTPEPREAHMCSNPMACDVCTPSHPLWPDGLTKPDHAAMVGDIDTELRELADLKADAAGRRHIEGQKLKGYVSILCAKYRRALLALRAVSPVAGAAGGEPNEADGVAALRAVLDRLGYGWPDERCQMAIGLHRAGVRPPPSQETP